MFHHLSCNNVEGVIFPQLPGGEKRKTHGVSSLVPRIAANARASRIDAVEMTSLGAVRCMEGGLTEGLTVMEGEAARNCLRIGYPIPLISHDFPTQLPFWRVNHIL